LGLRTLTIIDWALQTINSKQSTVVDITTIPRDDHDTYGVIEKWLDYRRISARITGYEGVNKKLKPDCFDDIIALVALFRPGPLESGYG